MPEASLAPLQTSQPPGTMGPEPYPPFITQPGRNRQKERWKPVPRLPFHSGTSIARWGPPPKGKIVSHPRAVWRQLSAHGQRVLLLPETVSLGLLFESLHSSGEIVTLPMKPMPPTEIAFNPLRTASGWSST